MTTTSDALNEAQERVRVRREADDRPGLAHALENVANRCTAAGRHTEAVEATGEQAAIHRAAQDRPALAHALVILGSNLLSAGEPEQAAAPARESVQLYKALKNLGGFNWAVQNLDRIGAVLASRQPFEYTVPRPYTVEALPDLRAGDRRPRAGARFRGGRSWCCRGRPDRSRCG